MPAGLPVGRGIAVELQPSSVSSGIFHSMALRRSISSPLPATAPARLPQCGRGRRPLFTSFSSHMKVGPLPQLRSSPRSPSLLVAYARNSGIVRESMYRVYDPRATGLVPARFTARGRRRFGGALSPWTTRRSGSSTSSTCQAGTSSATSPLHGRHGCRGRLRHRGLRHASRAGGAATRRVPPAGRAPGGRCAVPVYGWATSTRRWPG
jgi:hypothetical protein